MRLRNIPGAEEVIAASNYVIINPNEIKNNWKKVFQNEAPIHIEIGMGKGQFITTMAEKHPDINYIGIERYPSVLLRAVQRIEAMEQISNLRLLCLDAKEITDIFAQGEIAKIYLNFSDPWPKDRHAKRRLPSKEFLICYDNILTESGDIEFKTDNSGLFEFAVGQAAEADWKIKKITYDLHSDESMNEGNVMTEYEEKFSANGNLIHKYIIFRERQCRYWQIC